MARVLLCTGPGVFEVLARVCRNPQEALKQFVENAADAVDRPVTEDGRVEIRLDYSPRADGNGQAVLEQITVADNGVGMGVEKMRDVLQRIGDSEKLDLALRGEQGIGLLAFALIADELHLASSDRDGSPSGCLVLKRKWLKNGYAEILEHCSQHTRTSRGTTAYLSGILPEIAQQLSKERTKAYLGQQFASDLKAGIYTMVISDGGEMEHIHSQRFRGVKVMSSSLSPANKAASAFVELYVLPWEMPDAGLELYGRKGTRICPMTELGDFKHAPWTDQRLEGFVQCDRLKRTADKTAVVQDEVYRALVAELRQLEPQVQKLILEVSAESLEKRFNIIMNRAGRLIDRFIRYRERGILMTLPIPAPQAPNGVGYHSQIQPESPLAGEPRTPRPLRSTRAPYIRLKSPPQDRSGYRSWYDPAESVICINREHAEFLLSQREDHRCLRYLFSIWAKESLLQEFGADAEKVADEIVGVLAEAEPLLW
jgi:hypothetical protein